MIKIPALTLSQYTSSHSDASYLDKRTVTDLYQQMKESSSNSTATPGPIRSLSSAANLTSLCVDISPSSSNFFEVLYIGKIKVWNKKVPDTFIDDALEKFKIHDLEKSKSKLERLKTEINLRRGSVDSTASDTSSNRESSPLSNLQRSQSSVLTNLGVKSPDIDRKVLQSIRACDIDVDSKENSPAPQGDIDVDSKENSPAPQDLDAIRANRARTSSVSSVSSEKSDVQESARQIKITPADIDDHNRTMVLQVDRTDLRLISPDRKVILLHKHHKDVTTCIQGQVNSEHFGFIAKETSNSNIYIGFVFKCESSSVASEAVGAITQAFNNAETKNRPMVTSCDHCPMVWFHKLCCEVETLSDKKTQILIFRKIEQLDEEEQMVVLTKFRGVETDSIREQNEFLMMLLRAHCEMKQGRGVETDSIREQNEFLMMLLRAHCEMKQGRHVHDTVENRSEFLNQYLGGGNTIFMKAKRSLTSSFDNLLKRRASRDDFNPNLKEMTLPVNPILRENSPNESDSEGSMSRSSTAGSHSDLQENNSAPKDVTSTPVVKNLAIVEKPPKSPMLDIFLKVGSSPKPSPEEATSPSKQDSGSWRQAIFKRVVTPNKINKDERKRSREELRMLWKKSIHQAVLLIRMEKENARLKARQEETAVKRIKLEYDEMKSLDGASTLILLL
ncbi:protein of unknown function (DUF3350) [Popillia japonica]|uniref:PID domain-containing protein n=1 Tax=Popillia japonica TaxID=7064 RepID=A0AAW1N6W2_POPJA